MKGRGHCRSRRKSLLFPAALGDCVQASADGGKAAVKCRSFVLREGTADRIEDSANLLRDPFADLLPFFGQAQRVSVPFDPVGIPDDKSVRFQIVQRTGNGRLILLAVLAQLRRGHAIQRIYVVQTGHMGASQMIDGHLLIFYPPYVAADPVDQNRKRLKSLLHG